MKVYGQLEYAQLEQSTPGSIGAIGGRIYADITAPAAIIPRFHDGTAYRELLLRGLAYLTNADVNAAAAIAYSKLNLAGGIVNADVNAAAAILGSKISFTRPSGARLTSTGTATGYMFTITSGSATQGATYTNNGNTYTVVATIASSTRLFCTQASAPQASGTLTKTAGTGDSSITFSAAVAFATYILPVPAPNWLIVEGVGAGGGGGGSGSGSNGSGGNGGDTVWGPGSIIFGGGGGVSAAGGTNTIDGSFITLSDWPGMVGSTGGTHGSSAACLLPGGAAGLSPYGGGGQAGTGTGAAGKANTGSGGAAGGIGIINSGITGRGGSSGGFAKVLINNPSATYIYIIPAGGAAGTSGTSGNTGGAGATGGLNLFWGYN